MNKIKLLLNVFVAFYALINVEGKAKRHQLRKRGIETRTADGKVSIQDRFKYFASFEDAGTGTFCGGSLIAPNVIISAAHCFVDLKSPFQQTVRIGLYDNVTGNDNDEVISIENVAVHPGYNRVTRENDFALIKLVNYSKFDPVPIDNGACSRMKVGTLLTVIDFENTVPGGEKVEPNANGPFQGNQFQEPTKLLEVDVNYISNSECGTLNQGPHSLEWYHDAYDRPLGRFSDAEAFNNSITPSMLCAYSVEKDSCQGYSGGLLIVKGASGAQSDIQVGVSSFGISCGSVFPGVYARIRDQYPWIADTLVNTFKVSLASLAPLPTTLPEGCVSRSTPVPAPMMSARSLTGEFDLMLTELAEPSDNDSGRYVELFSRGRGGTAISEDLVLIRFTNANIDPTLSNRFPLKDKVVGADGFLVICCCSASQLIYDNKCDFVDDLLGGPVDSNGDDQIALALENQDGSFEIIDIFGVPGADGTGTNHDFSNSRAERKPSAQSPNPIYNANEWDIVSATTEEMTVREWAGVIAIPDPTPTGVDPNDQGLSFERILIIGIVAGLVALSAGALLFTCKTNARVQRNIHIQTHERQIYQQPQFANVPGGWQNNRVPVDWQSPDPPALGHSQPYHYDHQGWQPNVNRGELWQ